MKTMSIDASSTQSGWSVFEDGKYVKSGYVNLKKEKDSNRRIYEMAKQISELISHYNPDKIVLEDTMLSSNTSTLKLLSNLAGAIKFYCYIHNFEIITMYPSEWRKFCGIQEGKAKGNELKNRAFNVCIDQLGLTELVEDQAEAICIGLASAIKDGLFELKDVDDSILWD